MKPEFFIGYSEEVPPSFRSKIKRFVWVLAIGLVLVGTALVLSQRGFSDGTYELGNLSLKKGILRTMPLPHLVVYENLEGKERSPEEVIMLMSFGKFGAEEDLEKIRQKVLGETGKDLDQVLVTLEGTLDYRDGKTLFELTNKEESLVDMQVLGPGVSSKLLLGGLPYHQTYGTVSLAGEIVDSKCYFGTMKPGEGKPHRSCAIRCISGGIPPILMVQNEAGEKEGYLLRGTDEQAINQELLSVVADPVQVKGELVRFYGWNILYLDPATDIELIK